VAQQALDAAGIALRLPKRLDGLVTRIEDGSLSVANPRLERQLARLDRTVRRAASALIFGALLIAGSIVRADDAVLGGVLMIVSVVPLLHGAWVGRRSR
jgi:hypothetical protein